MKTLLIGLPSVLVALGAAAGVVVSMLVGSVGDASVCLGLLVVALLVIFVVLDE